MTQVKSAYLNTKIRAAITLCTVVFSLLTAQAAPVSITNTKEMIESSDIIVAAVTDKVDSGNGAPAIAGGAANDAIQLSVRQVLKGKQNYTNGRLITVHSRVASDVSGAKVPKYWGIFIRTVAAESLRHMPPVR